MAIVPENQNSADLSAKSNRMFMSDQVNIFVCSYFGIEIGRPKPFPIDKCLMCDTMQ